MTFSQNIFITLMLTKTLLMLYLATISLFSLSVLHDKMCKCIVGLFVTLFIFYLVSTGYRNLFGFLRHMYRSNNAVKQLLNSNPN